MNKPQIEQLKTADLIPYARNSRTHSDSQVAQISASIKEFGFTNPILIDNDNGIIAGHGRVMAAGKLSLETVPCIRLGYLTETQKRAYIIADNKLALNAGWDAEMLALELSDLKELDFDLDLLGFDDDEITKLMAEIEPEFEPLTDDDQTPEPPVNPVTKLGDVWICGKHRIMCGDSTNFKDVENLMNSDVADMIFTDPPYNVKVSGLGSAASQNSIGKIHGEFKMASGEMSKTEFTDFLRAVFTCLISVSKNGSIHYICMDWRHIQELTSAGEIYNEFKNLCIWNKNNGGMGTFYRNKHELIFVYKNGTEKHTNNFMLGETGRYRTNVWDYPMVTAFANEERGNEKLHPTVKPAQLVIDAILDCSNDGEIILDLFGGSGTTMIACEKTNRIARLMELDEKYCDVIVKRWQEFTGKKAFLESTRVAFDDC